MCDIGGCGPFQLTVNILRKGGEEKVTIEASPQDLVQEVIGKLEPTFQAHLRHHGEFDNFPADLTLLDNGVSQAMEVDLQVSCMMKE
mmetsp:Transcript_109355/g.340717  ORF Transcript_109355/g.340717 Transcript_109355/m.340717 type:complete len:87 (+) Transcript_109355:48-308(+)